MTDYLSPVIASICASTPCTGIHCHVAGLYKVFLAKKYKVARTVSVVNCHKFFEKTWSRREQPGDPCQGHTPAMILIKYGIRQ